MGKGEGRGGGGFPLVMNESYRRSAVQEPRRGDEAPKSFECEGVLCPSEETPAQNTKTVATHDRPATTAQVTVCDYLFVHQDESPETPVKSEQSLMLKL